MDEIHPIRYWRLKKNLGEQLDYLRKLYERNVKKYGPPKDGVHMMEAPLNIDLSILRSLEDLQGALYKNNESQHWTQFFLHFWDESRQVFVMDSELTEQLAETEIGDVPWSELKLPHSTFFVSFGDYGQPEFEIGDFRYIIDGAYVRQIDKRSVIFPHDTLMMYFTARLVYPSYREAKEIRALNNYSFAEPVYEFCLSGEGCKTIGDALQRGESDFRKQCQRMDDNGYEVAKQLGPEYGLYSGRRMNFMEMKFDRGKEIILHALPVLFNSIFYLCQKPEARIEGFPKSAPSNLVQEWRGTRTPEIRKSLESHLERKGFSKVYFVRDADSSRQDRLVNNEDRKRIRSHWRRGHWRNQPYGTNANQRKWLWIKPTLVKKNEPLSLGTIHDVRDSDQVPPMRKAESEG